MEVFTTKEAYTLRDALLDAYTYQSLEQMLFFELGKELQHIASNSSNLTQVVFDVIRASMREGWVDNLVHAAHDANPRNPKLKAFVGQYVRYQGNASALERVIEETNGFIDVAAWRTKLERIEHQVCSIEIGGDHRGTGFLINHDLIMTNYHVVQSLLKKNTQSVVEQVRIRFDFKKSPDGAVVNDGKRYKLNGEEWLVDTSPYSEAEGNNDFEKVPTVDELDYAILRVAMLENSEYGTTPGNENIGISNKRRGWIHLAKPQNELSSGDALFIMQHPDHMPLKMALATNSVIGFNENRTRIRHKTNTEGGSSGSPCFNSDWELVALHHAGDPTWNKPQWNQAVPLRTIRHLWEQKNKLSIILAGDHGAELSPEAATEAEVDDMLQIN